MSGLKLNGIDWAIVGGESGPGARPMKESWVLDIRDQCVAADVPFFFEQWGGVRKKKAGRLLEGRTWDQMPQFNMKRKRGCSNSCSVIREQLTKFYEARRRPQTR